MKKRNQCAMFFMAMLCVVGFGSHPDVDVFINEEPIVFDVLPIIENGSVLVPMRGIFESLSCEVSWEADTQQVIAHTAKGEEVMLFIGKDQLYLNDEVVYTMPVLPKIVDGRTLVPLRAVSEALGAEVTWDGETYTVYIESAETDVTIGTLGENTTYTMLNDVFHAKLFHQGNTILEVIIDLSETTSYLPSIKTALVKEAEIIAKAVFDNYRAEALTQYEEMENSETFIPICVTGEFEKTFSNSSYASFVFRGEHNEVSSGKTELHGVTLELGSYEKIVASQLFSGVTMADLYSFYQLALENIIAEDTKKVISGTVMNRFEILKTKIGFYIDNEENITFFFPEKTIADVDAGIIAFSLPLVLVSQ